MLSLCDFIPLASPNILQEDIDEVCRVLRSGMLVQSVEVRMLESNLEEYLGVKHVVCVSNGTASLHLALLALGIGKGDEVIVPAFSYVATANVVEIVGAKPVFVDIDLATFNIDTEQLDFALSSRTKAIMPVHEFGLSADLDAINEFARINNLYVIEDAACALGSKYNDRMVGGSSDFSSFSFHPRKAITSGEGGFLATNSDALANKVRIMRNHGISAQGTDMHFVEAGFNYRLTEFQAALVNSQLKRLESMIDYKQVLAGTYLDKLVNSRIQTPSVPNNCRHSWQTFHVLLDDKLNRDSIIVKLKDVGVGTNYGAQCIPLVDYYKSKYQLDCKALYPNALRAYKSGLALPLYEKLLTSHIDRVCDIISEILI